MIDDIIFPKFSFFFQGNDYGAGRNKAVKDKCRNKIKNLKKCQKRHRGSKRKCRKWEKKADKCIRENKITQEDPAQDTTTQVELLQI